MRLKIHVLAYLLAGIRYAASTIRLLRKMLGKDTILENGCLALPRNDKFFPGYDALRKIVVG